MKPQYTPSSSFFLHVPAEVNVPGKTGASATLQKQFDALPTGAFVTVEATGALYVKSLATTFAAGNRIELVSSGTSDMFLAADGSAAAPSYSFASDTNTGMYLFGADTIGFAAGGASSSCGTSHFRPSRLSSSRPSASSLV